MWWFKEETGIKKLTKGVNWKVVYLTEGLGNQLNKCKRGNKVDQSEKNID